MTTVPSTIMVQSTNQETLPCKMLYAICKQIFRFGVKKIVVVSDLIFVHLSYTPQRKTLQKKFGNLPIRYFRIYLENYEEISLFVMAVRNFSFDTTPVDEEREMSLPAAPTHPPTAMIATTSAASSGKQKRHVDGEGAEPSTKKKKHRMELDESKGDYDGQKLQ